MCLILKISGNFLFLISDSYGIKFFFLSFLLIVILIFFLKNKRKVLKFNIFKKEEKEMYSMSQCYFYNYNIRKIERLNFSMFLLCLRMILKKLRKI